MREMYGHLRALGVDMFREIKLHVFMMIINLVTIIGAIQV